MKKVFVFLLPVFFSFFAQAQEAIEAKISLMKADQPCVKSNYAVPTEILETAWESYLSKNNIKKGDKFKGGFKVYKGVVIPSISSDKIDLYSIIDGKKDNSSINILVAKGYDNFVTRENDSAAVTAMKSILNNLIGEVNIASVKKDINDQEELVSKADKNQKNEIKQGESLADDLKKLEKRIEDNKKDQENAKNKLQEESAKLSELKAKLDMMNK